MMDITMQQKDCDALAGLFQHIVTDLRTSSPVWEDFVGKSLKLHTVLRTTAASMGAFLDAFQKVADLANNSHGATRELGSALTRLCIRHRSVETTLKTFASAIVEKLHEPLQGKIEEWKRVATQMDKDHSRDYKKAQQEIKKMSVDIPKLQKRAGKGRSDARQKLDQVLLSVGNKCQLLENAEVTAVRSVMLEEHTRFCFFVECLQPLMDGEMSILHELGRIQEVIDIILELTKDAASLPQSGEQVLVDLKSAANTTSIYQTPPGSPVLSSLSRKSSLCSMDSSSSGSTHHSVVSQSPNHRLTLPLHALSSTESSFICQLSSISSQDSGFVSHDVLASSDVSQNQDNNFVSQLKRELIDIDTVEISENVDAPVVISQPTAFDVLAHSASGPSLCSVFHTPCERPRTISSAYDRTLSRPQVTARTFEPPHGYHKAPATTSVYATPTNIYRQTADIYARPTLCGRRFSQGAVAVAPPVVPSHYATFQKPRINGGGNSDVKSVASDKEEEIMQAHIHRSSSLPSPVYSAEAEHSATDCRQLSSCGTLNQLQHRHVLVKDDNYITHTYAVLDARKQTPSKDYESICEVINSKHAAVDESLRSLTLPRCHQTLPRCHPFKVPEVPVYKSSVGAERNFAWRSSTLGRSSTRVKPLPPARSISVKTNSAVSVNTDAASCPRETNVSSNNTVSQTEESPCDSRTALNVTWQPRQQAPPTDDSDVLFPSPPPELSCHVADATAIQLTRDSPDTLPFVTTTETVQPTCWVDQNLVQPNVATAESDGVVEETDIDSIAHINDADNMNSVLALIRKGVKLRKTATNDRSAPKLN